MNDLLHRIEHAFLRGELAEAQHLLIELECRGVSAAEARDCAPVLRRLRATVERCRVRDRMLRSVYFAEGSNVGS